MNNESPTTVTTMVGQMMEGDMGLMPSDYSIDVACGKCCFGCNDYDEEFIREVQNVQRQIIDRDIIKTEYKHLTQLYTQNKSQI